MANLGTCPSGWRDAHEVARAQDTRRRDTAKRAHWCGFEHLSISESVPRQLGYVKFKFSLQKKRLDKAECVGYILVNRFR